MESRSRWRARPSPRPNGGSLGEMLEQWRAARVMVEKPQTAQLDSGNIAYGVLGAPSSKRQCITTNQLAPMVQKTAGGGETEVFSPVFHIGY